MRYRCTYLHWGRWGVVRVVGATRVVFCKRSTLRRWCSESVVALDVGVIVKQTGWRSIPPPYPSALVPLGRPADGQSVGGWYTESIDCGFSNGKPRACRINAKAFISNDPICVIDVDRRMYWVYCKFACSENHTAFTDSCEQFVAAASISNKFQLHLRNVSRPVDTTG